MATTANIAAYSDALVVLGTAGIFVPFVRRWGLNPILGYLGAGAVLGPLGLGSQMEHLPLLYWFTVVDAENVAGIAELGVVFLLFLIGLELSLRRLITMRRLVFGLGGAQVLLTSLAIGGTAALFGQGATAAIVIGSSLALSSTAIVLELLSSERRLATSVGRTSFAILLGQDITVIPILMFAQLAAAGSDGPVALSLASALGQAAAALAVIIVLGRFLMRPLFRLVASTASTELFIAAVLFVIVAAGLIASAAGMSMALGAFVAGLLLAETEYGKAIQATVEPFKGLLLGIFFFTVGMNIDVRSLLQEPLWILAAVAALIAGKGLLIALLGRAFRLSWPVALATALMLAGGGEFAFVAIGVAAGRDLLPDGVAGFVLAVVSISMALTPLLASVATRLKRRLEAGAGENDPEIQARPAKSRDHAIVVGYGRVGKVVCELLAEHGIPFVAADKNAITVTADRRAGHPVFYGDATDAEFLKACGVLDAAGVIITTDASDLIDQVVHNIRRLRPDLLVVARARDAEHARHLYRIGATDAVPETVEASLQLAEAALVGLGTPVGPVIASIHEKRDVFRRTLRGAAEQSGRANSYALRRHQHPSGRER